MSSLLQKGQFINFSNEYGLQAVVGKTDGRKPVSNIISPPWSSIVKLSITGRYTDNIIGTGFFIETGIIATAAHCIQSNILSGKAEKITIEGISENNSSFSLTLKNPDKFHTPFFWDDDEHVNYDYGLIDLRDAGVKGIVNFHRPSEQNFEGYLANIAGFPVDLDRGNKMLHHASAIDSIASGEIRYRTDTGAGQSGGPIWCYTDTESNTPYLIGIHVQKGYSHVNEQANIYSDTRAKAIFVDNIGVALNNTFFSFLEEIKSMH